MLAGDDLVLEQALGEGGAATIYAARWRGREVSAKVARSVDDDAAGDVHAEARMLARVSHEALLEVLGTGRLLDGRPYLLLPRLRGQDLAARLRRSALPMPRALEVVTAVGSALAALHAAGVLHRDLKPENVFLTDDGGVFLLDLGLARDAGARTASLRIRGTYDAMAPERLYGESAGIASEVYELAALAWATLAGSLPWPPGAAPSARRWIPSLPVAGSAGAALEAVLRGALSTLPERRPPSAEHLVRALHEASRAPALPVHDRRTAELRSDATPAPAGPSPTIGAIIADTYRLVSVLRSGGAGTVFAAEHLRLPRRFAIKILHPDRDDPDARTRFRREAETVASLSHPHIVEVFDYDVDDHGIPFMVMELLEGETLRDRLRRGPLPLASVIEVIRQTAGAVAAAHARGVVHRDLKPSNLFLRTQPDGTIDLQVLDFGISKVLGDPGERTVTGLILGSPGYAAPEQIRGDPASIGPATDVFALAAIAYEALGGLRAFEAATRDAVLHHILHADPPPLHRRGIARALDDVVRGGLAKRPERRPASIVAFAEALAAAAAGHRRWSHQRRAAIRASAVAILALALIIVAVVAKRGTELAAGGAENAEVVAPADAVARQVSERAAAVLSLMPAPSPDSPRSPSSGSLPAPSADSSGAASSGSWGAPSPDSLPAPPSGSLPAPSSGLLSAPSSGSSPSSASLASAPGSPPSPTSPPGMSTVRLVIRPATARVVVDGTVVQGDTVALAQGRHSLRVSAPGFQPLARIVDTAELGGVLRAQLRRGRPRATRPPELRDLLEQ